MTFEGGRGEDGNIALGKIFFPSLASVFLLREPRLKMTFAQLNLIVSILWFGGLKAVITTTNNKTITKTLFSTQMEDYKRFVLRVIAGREHKPLRK